MLMEGTPTILRDMGIASRDESVAEEEGGGALTLIRSGKPGRPGQPHVMLAHTAIAALLVSSCGDATRNVPEPPTNVKKGDTAGSILSTNPWGARSSPVRN